MIFRKDGHSWVQMYSSNTDTKEKTWTTYGVIRALRDKGFCNRHDDYWFDELVRFERLEIPMQTLVKK